MTSTRGSQPIDSLTPLEKARQVAALEEQIRLVQAYPERRHCDECASFRDGYCGHWEDNVPEDARLDGCEEWDGIPY